MICAERMGRLLLATCVLAVLPMKSALAREISVTVDGRSGPWDSRSNPKLFYGLNDGRPPKVIWNAFLFPGARIRFKAAGAAGWITGGDSFGPDGDPEITIDRSMTNLPSLYVRDRRKPLHMMTLMGAFVDADGRVVGDPFAVGSAAEVAVPDGALAISLGVNDDRLSDNFGAYQVTVNIPEPSVIVEPQPEPDAK